MTAQFGEALHYDGQDLTLCSEPLGDYFTLAGIEETQLDCSCTALWRGYIGNWEINGGRLYLIGLRGHLEDGTKVNVETFFPGYPERVFAHWYTGELRAPQGKLLNYVHGGYASTYESDLLISVKNGVVTKTDVRRNGISDDADAKDGHQVAAMTTF